MTKDKGGRTLAGKMPVVPVAGGTPATPTSGGTPATPTSGQQYGVRPVRQATNHSNAQQRPK